MGQTFRKGPPRPPTAPSPFLPPPFADDMVPAQKSPSATDDPSTWRLRTSGKLTGVQVPFRFMGCEGSFEPDNGAVHLRVLIPSTRLVPFLNEVFPSPIRIGNLSIPQVTNLPGMQTMVLKRVAFKSQDNEKPIDPFEFDYNASDLTYHPLVVCEMEFAPRSCQLIDANDPSTFVEVTGNTTGEFIHSTAPKAMWQPKKVNPGTPGAIGSGAYQSDTVEPGANPGNPAPPTLNPKEPVRDATVPMMLVVPQTEWSVKWKQIPYDYFKEVLIARIRWCLGRVNEKTFPLLFDAAPETILFIGYSYSQIYSWRDGVRAKPPIDLEMKFIEKRVVWEGVVKGHNDFWRPGKGWEYLLIDGTNPTYEKKDFLALFRV